jgi:hypothetical protein
MDVEEQPESDVRWHGVKARMARMVQSHGCDALVDHVIVYRAVVHSWLRPDALATTVGSRLIQ